MLHFHEHYVGTYLQLKNNNNENGTDRTVLVGDVALTPVVTDSMPVQSRFFINLCFWFGYAGTLVQRTLGAPLWV